MPDTLFATLLHWSPALLRGLGINVGISLLAVGLGTLVGLAIGALHLSPVRGLRHLAGVYVIAFRNAPWLVLVYGIAYAVPFEIVVRGHVIPFPDWLKVTFALALPASAHVAEIFRGAVQSIPHTQWEAAASLAFTRRDILWRIVLPQCVQRMAPFITFLPQWWHCSNSIGRGFWPPPKPEMSFTTVANTSSAASPATA